MFITERSIAITMWTKAKSATLSLICTRILIGMIILVAVMLPLLIPVFSFFSNSAMVVNGSNFYGGSPDAGMLYVGMSADSVKAIFICAYASIAPALIALLALDMVLRNIRKELVFVRVNVKGLRIISWCCFAIAIIMLCGEPFISYVLFFVAATAAFFGLLMRVVKNVIDAACEIKDENDYTI